MGENTKSWAFPGIVFVSAFAMSAACGSQGPGDLGNPNCPSESPSTTSSTAGPGSGAGSTGAGASTGATGPATSAASTGSGSTGSGATPYDAPQPAEIESRLHSCHKLPFKTLGTFLSRRGVAVPPGDANDSQSTSEMVFGNGTTIGALFGGNNSACTEAPDPISDGFQGQLSQGCPTGQQCYCNQSVYDDPFLVNPFSNQPNENKTCTRFGSTAEGFPLQGYCVGAGQSSSAAFLYYTGKDSFSVPKIDSRNAEKEEHSTSSALRLMDIFVQAAPQIIQNIGNPSKAPACTVNGVNQPMFDPSDGSCVRDSVSCLIGMPATDDHMLLCNLILKKADPNVTNDLQKKQIIAVAALLSAAHACE